jgi:hypothetical protein
MTEQLEPESETFEDLLEAFQRIAGLSRLKSDDDTLTQLGDALEHTPDIIDTSHQHVLNQKGDTSASGVVVYAVARILHTAIYLREFSRATAATISLTNPSFTRDYLLIGVNTALEDLLAIKNHLSINPEGEPSDLPKSS